MSLPVDFQIESVCPGDEPAVPVGSPSPALSANAADVRVGADSKRIAAFVREYHGFAWRVLRRFGLAPADADDAAQRVFMIAASRLGDIAQGSERAFLFRTAAHIASKVHRARRQRPDPPSDHALESADPRPLPDALLEQRRARDLLDRILGELPQELHAVFVLFEIEGLRAPEVADALEIPLGTVASRLRRARAEVSERLARHQAHSMFKGRLP
ncbi:MAG TPA: sigma-70 family RNA polymerase sigma factor [Polyangiaceae bacterium]|nr:sigma-70 family RNA polymerase sigma factor [Polyangiaceae bacterium]